MNLKFSIQSVSDIITNSSTEIYTVWYKDYTEKTIKGMVNSLLKFGNTDLCFDDLFTIEFHWYGEENYKDYGFSSIEDYIKELEDNSGWLEKEDRGVSNWYEVKVKPEAEKLLDVDEIVKFLNDLSSSFDSEYYDN